MSNKKRNDNGNGSTRKRADGKWEGRYSAGYDPATGKLISRSVYGKTQKEVRQKLNEILRDLQDGTYVAPNKMTVSEWLDIWLKEYTLNIRPATKAAYEQHVRVHLKPALGRIQLSKLLPHQIQQNYNDLLRKRGLSPKSIKNVHGVLHRALEQAKLMGYLKTNPATSVVLPKAEKAVLKTMEDTDVARFLQEIKDDPYENVLFVTAFTGLREGEVLGLTWDCVDFEKGQLLINKQHSRAKGEKEFHFSPLKNSKIRTITVAQEVLNVLEKQRKQQERWQAILGDKWDNQKNLVFTTEFGRYINNKTLYMNYKRIMRKLGFPQLRFHDLRHTYAVNSLRAGDDIKTVQENLGHATASFTLGTYAHATPGMKRESAGRMNDFIQRLTNAEKVPASPENP